MADSNCRRTGLSDAEESRLWTDTLRLALHFLQGEKVSITANCPCPECARKVWADDPTMGRAEHIVEVKND